MVFRTVTLFTVLLSRVAYSHALPYPFNVTPLWRRWRLLRPGALAVIGDITKSLQWPNIVTTKLQLLVVLYNSNFNYYWKLCCRQDNKDVNEIIYVGRGDTEFNKGVNNALLLL